MAYCCTHSTYCACYTSTDIRQDLGGRYLPTHHGYALSILLRVTVPTSNAQVRDLTVQLICKTHMYSTYYGVPAGKHVLASEIRV